MSCSTHLAGSGDLDQLAPLFDAYRRFYGQPGDPARARDFLAERLVRQESYVFLARDAAGEALGFTQLYPTFSSIQCRRTLILNDLYVHPPARGRGVGEALLGAARALGLQLGAASIALQTAPDNEPAQRLYQRFGFVPDWQYLAFSHALP